MSTFSEVGKQYADRIVQALASDGFVKVGSVRSSQLPASRTLSAFKAIGRDIDQLVMSDTKKPLSEEQKRAIYEAIAQELRLRSAVVSESMVRCASNDDLTDVVDYIDQILQGRGK